MLYDALKRLSKHSLIYSIGPTIHKAAGFLLIPVVTRYIGTTGNYGVKEIAEVTLVIMGQVLGINLLSGMTRYYSGYEDEEDRAKLVTTTLALLGCTAGSALIVGMLAAGPIGILLFDGSEFAPAVRAVAVILFFQLVGHVGLRYLQIRERSGIYGVLTVSKLFLEIVLKVVFLAALGLEYMGVLYSVMVGEVLLGTGLSVWILARLRFGFSWTMAKRLIRFTYPLIATGLCMFVLHQADRFIVLKIRGADEVGLYGLCYKFGSMVNALLLTSFILIWFPYIFSLKDEEEVKIVCRKVVTYFVLLTTAASLVVAIFAREIVQVMSDASFHEAYTPIPLILAGYIFWAIFQLVHTSFYLKERTGWTSILVGGGAALNVALNLLLVPRYGYEGAACVTLITFGVLTAATFLVSERLFPVHYEVKRIVAPIALGTGLFLASLAIPQWPLTGVVLAKIGLLALFPVILLVGGYLTGQEKEKLQAIAGAARARLRR
jgi:O-antigen/teichoic acid export membrane protein